MQDIEKLGVFYLGRAYDLASRQPTEPPTLYDSRDLTTHAVCVGMTGSGKTGLGVSLIEEAAIDGIPVIAIDPKGDLTNLLLAFPQMRPEDFAPWVDAEEGARQGLAPDAYAAKVAQTWSKGLEAWGQDGARVGRYCGAADRAVYTPGGGGGLPLAMVRSLAPPSRESAVDPEALRDRVLSSVSGLMALLGLEADPVQSREHILLSTILDRAWREGRAMDLTALVREVQTPPFDRIGVVDLESFFPSKERVELAMRLNNLLASPGFARWLEGEPLDVGRLLHTPEGRPRVSVLSIAHLSDAERMFFVTVLLGEVLAWMRSQPGTSSLRAILYMDEIFGFFPPTANPPAKGPMLTLLKQARAFGLGVVLATQNPVDLDYKGLANAGTWFVGRLQTERDKARLLDGLEGASAASGAPFDRQQMEATLASLGSRVFLMHNVHEDAPVVFQTRWTLSYLRGPLTTAQIRRLVQPIGATATQGPAPSAAPAPVPASGEPAGSRPLVPPEVTEVFLAPKRGAAPTLYRPMLLCTAKVHYVSVKENVDAWQTLTALAPLPDGSGAPAWDQGTFLQQPPEAGPASPAAGAGFASLPAQASRPQSYGAWKKAFADFLYQSRPLSLFSLPELKLTSRPGEDEGAFRARAALAGREARDQAMEKLRQGYAPKVARLQDQLKRAEDRADREADQYGAQKVQAAVSLGATLVGALFGRKLGGAGTVGRAATTLRGAGRAYREKEDVDRAQAGIEELRQQIAALDAEVQQACASVPPAAAPMELVLRQAQVPPRKSDTSVGQVALAWTPWRAGADGLAEPLF